MVTSRQQELFDHLCRSRPLKEWLAEQLAEQDKILRVNPDNDTLRKAQGRAQFIMSFQDKLAAAEAAANAR